MHAMWISLHFQRRIAEMLLVMLFAFSMSDLAAYTAGRRDNFDLVTFALRRGLRPALTTS